MPSSLDNLQSFRSVNTELPKQVAMQWKNFKLSYTSEIATVFILNGVCDLKAETKFIPIALFFKLWLEI